MNSKFNDKQIEAYAAAFREGDAIWCDGEWRKVTHSNETWTLTTESPNLYVVRNTDGDSVTGGFFHTVTPYRVTTLYDYDLQGGEKLVWLGESCYYRTFGKTYETFLDGDEGNVVYRNDAGDLAFRVAYSEWGVIPRYDQVARNKFNVGDKVLVNKFIGGTVVEVLGNDKYLVSIVYRSGMEERNEFNGFQLELAKEEPPAPRVITFNEEEINKELDSEVTDFDMDLHHVLSDLESTLKSKNKDYGDSFKQSYDEFGMTAVNIRLTDKFNRFKQLAKGAEPQVDESLKDTIKDIAGYMVLTLIELNREDDGDE